MALTADPQFPAKLDRDDEQRLLDLASSRDVNSPRWLTAGSRFFMAGFAVMLASLRGMDRRKLLELAERLHPGSSQPEVFSLWLARSPLKPSRFAPLLRERLPSRLVGHAQRKLIKPTARRSRKISTAQ
jgi:hypothetical protein